MPRAVAADRNRDPRLALDVVELLAVGRYGEIEGEIVVGVADKSGLRPSGAAAFML
jgi:hypothetical protein